MMVLFPLFAKTPAKSLAELDPLASQPLFTSLTGWIVFLRIFDLVADVVEERMVKNDGT